MKKLKYLLVLIIIPCILLLSACELMEFTSYSNDFSNGNNGTFTNTEGNITDNNGTIIISKDSNEEGPITYFGRDNYNTNWNGTSMQVSIKFNIESDKYNLNEGFNWSVGINDVEKKFLSEKSIYFRKFEDGVKVGFENGYGTNIINQMATSKNNAVTLEDGWHEVVFKIYPGKNSIAKADIKVIKDNEVVFEAKESDLAELNPVNNTYNTIHFNKVGGIRYGKISWMSIDSIEVDDLKLSYLI